MKYVVYLRVSTDQQGLGLDAQREICNRYISRSPAIKIIEFVDEGFSGALEMDKRPGLLSAIAELDKGSVLLVAKRDRIGRDPIINAMIERAVERKKAKLISASGDVSEGNDPSSILMRRMIDSFSEYERLIIGARTKAALQVKKNKGERTGHIPYGYKLSEDGIHLEKEDSEQKILLNIKQLKEKRYSLRAIANTLNIQRKYNRKGTYWTHVSIKRVYENKFQVA